MSPTIEILIIGDEILAGKTVDANAPYMRDRLIMAGFHVDFITVSGDSVESISGAAKNAVNRADIVLVSGGLGPTSDDITVESVAGALDCPLELNEDVLADIVELFKRRGRDMSESNKKQAMIPKGAKVLDNPHGTAPGIRFEAENTIFYFMPGVPREMQTIFDESILPDIREDFTPARIETATVSINGISESELYDRIKHLPGAREALAFYPKYSGIEIRIKTGENAPATAEELKQEIVATFGSRVFSTSGETLEKVVGDLMAVKGLTVAVAESCTGGLISSRLTDIPGSSAYLLLGAVTYSNESKTAVLGVDPALIKQHGAVSGPVAAAMAEGVRKAAEADIGLSTTGIAGPGGATKEKPLGLMYTAVSDKHGTETKKLQFAEDRRINKSRMSQAVLDILRHRIISKYGG